MRILLALLALALAGAEGSAFAHGGGAHVGFVSTVSMIEPPQPGLLVKVFRGHELLSVRNLMQKSVVIFDEDGGEALRLAPGESGSFADPRIGSTGPPPDEGEFVKDWRIPGEADGERFEIVGFLGYRPPPGLRSDSDLPTWAMALLGAGGALVVAAALALPLRRRKGEDGRPRTATER